MEDEENLFGLFQGCPVHGEEFMKECSACGGEYCTQCFPGAKVCPSCLAQVDDDDDADDDNPDFSDVDDLDTLIGEDEEVDDIIRQSDEMYGDGFD